MPMWRDGRWDDVVHRGTSARITTRPTYSVFCPMKIYFAPRSSDWTVDDVLVAGRSILGSRRSVRGDELEMVLPRIAVQVGVDFSVDVTYIGHEPDGVRIVASAIGAMSSVYGGRVLALPAGVTFDDLPYPRAV
jgi:hypothetical protein